MACDSDAYLPGNVRIKDVARVIGLCFGGTPAWLTRPNYVEVRSVGVKNTSSVEMACIEVWEDKKCIAEMHYHFELGPPYIGRRGVGLGSSCAARIAVGVRLVDFFGGTVVFNDHEPKIVYSVPDKSDEENHPTGDEGWNDLQRRIGAVPPLTKGEIKFYDQFAAYKLKEMRHPFGFRGIQKGTRFTHPLVLAIIQAKT